MRNIRVARQLKHAQVVYENLINAEILGSGYFCQVEYDQYYPTLRRMSIPVFMFTR